MCGILGYFDRTGASAGAIGQPMYKMLEALGRRGPDSAGVALYADHPGDGLVLQISLGGNGSADRRAQAVVERAGQLGQVGRTSTTAGYLRLALRYHGDPAALERALQSAAPGIEVVSLGRRLEIVKQVGTPKHLEATYRVARRKGSHGIGHTRMCTESRVDLSHSQPFWAHGHPDLAIVHNGHITNYHKLRRVYEQRGVKFYTENDSEVIGIYLAEQLARGLDLHSALAASRQDLDGSFSYLAATADAMGFAKDVFAFKPLLVSETDEFAAVATEEIALRAALGNDCPVREAQAGEVRVWQR